MSGAIPPLTNTPSWRGAQLKHRDNFIFTFTFTFYILLHTILVLLWIFPTLSQNPGPALTMTSDEETAPFVNTK
jgi:hypothetical protein